VIVLSFPNRRIKGLEAYWIAEVRRKVLARCRPCSHPVRDIESISPHRFVGMISSSFDRILTLEDIEVLLGRTVRLEEDSLPDSDRSECQSARSARSAFDVDVVRRLTCE
jgi:hypothetical protein